MAGVRRGFRKAFTLVELLVAIAIIAVLMGLLIPGVQMVRESGRKVHCRSNLRTMALAMHSYETAHRVFPAGYAANPAAPDVDATTLDASPGTGWGLAIAAFLDEQRAAAAVRPTDPAWGVASPQAADVVAATLPVFLCASATGPREPFAGAGPTAVRIPPAPGWDGRTTWPTPVKPTPGTCHRRFGHGTASPTGRCIATHGFGRLRSATGCRRPCFSASTPPPSRKAGLAWCQGAASHPGERVAALLGGHADAAAALVIVHSGPAEDEMRIIHPPNDPAAHADQMFSDHPGGAHVALGDGSVRFISELIHHPTWAAMSSINGGENVAGAGGE